jgi:hypothetical protein
MARIRTIKPEFWTSETIARLSIPARLTFIGMWNEADDYGVLPDNARVLKGHIWPLEDSVGAGDVEMHLAEIAHQGLIQRYEAEDRKLIFVVGWDEHQQVNRPSKRKHPAPPAQTSPSLSTHGGLTEGSPQEQGTGNREQGTFSSSSERVQQGLSTGPLDDDDDQRLRPTLELVAQKHAATNGKTNRRGYAATVIANAFTDGQIDDIRALLAAHPTRDPTWLADEHLGRTHPPDPNCHHCGQPRHTQGPCPTLLKDDDR